MQGRIKNKLVDVGQMTTCKIPAALRLKPHLKEAQIGCGKRFLSVLFSVSTFFIKPKFVKKANYENLHDKPCVKDSLALRTTD